MDASKPVLGGACPWWCMYSCNEESVPTYTVNVQTLWTAFKAVALLKDAAALML